MGDTGEIQHEEDNNMININTEELGGAEGYTGEGLPEGEGTHLNNLSNLNNSQENPILNHTDNGQIIQAHRKKKVSFMEELF